MLLSTRDEKEMIAEIETLSYRVVELTNKNKSLESQLSEAKTKIQVLKSSVCMASKSIKELDCLKNLDEIIELIGV